MFFFFVATKCGAPRIPAHQRGSWEFSSEILQEKPKDGQHGSPKSLFSASVWRLFWKMDSGGETSLFEVDWNFHFFVPVFFWLESFLPGVFLWNLWQKKRQKTEVFQVGSDGSGSVEKNRQGWCCGIHIHTIHGTTGIFYRSMNG